MKTFSSYDNTLCDNEKCEKKDTCVRYLTHLKALKERYPYPLSIYVGEGKCDIYVKVKEK